MQDIYLVCLYQTMYIFSTSIHTLCINIGLFRNVKCKYTTFCCCFNCEYTELQL